MSTVVIPIRSERVDAPTEQYPECKRCRYREGGDDCDPCYICDDADEFEQGNSK